MTNKKLSTRWTRISAMALLSALVVAPAAYAQEVTTRFSIPSQPLASGLLAIGGQARLSVAAPSALVAGKLGHAVQGEFTARQALGLLLEGTGLRYEFVAPNAVRILEGQAPQSAGTSDPSRLGGESESRQVAEIVVIGTHIRGQPPVGTQAFTLSRDDIQQTGRTTASELLKTVPQNQSLGASEGLVGARGQGQVNNSAAGSSVNLRGLGADATLVLVNGRRIAPAEAGAFVDVSQIPLSVVEVVEVLPDGASALYGSDAIGGVVNFVLRKRHGLAESGLRYRLGSGFHEYSGSQSLGFDWSSGSLNLAYDYYRQTNLAWSKRDYYRGDLSALGGTNYNLQGTNGVGNPGNIIVQGVSYAIPRGQNGRSLNPASLKPGTRNIEDHQTGQDILPDQLRHSLVATFAQDLSPQVHLFADALYSVRDFAKRSRAVVQSLEVPSTNPFFVSPLAGAKSVIVEYSFGKELVTRTEGTSKNYTFTSGANFDLPKDWNAEVYVMTGRDDARVKNLDSINLVRLAQALADPNPATAFNPFGDGANTPTATLQKISGGGTTHQTYDITSLNAGANGALFDVPGGTVRMALGAEYRKERYELASLFDQLSLTPERGTDDGRSERTITAAYVELMAPLVGPDNAMPGIQRLELSLAARTEHYDDFGSTTNPKIGLRWRPVESLSLRGGWGTSFKAPRLVQLNEGGNIYRGTPFPNPGAIPGLTSPFPGYTNVVALLGFGNRNLQPETAETWSVGADFKPEKIPGFSAHLTYYDVKYENRIQGPTVLEVSKALAGTGVGNIVLARSPTQAQLNAIYSAPNWYVADPRLPAGEVGAIVSLAAANYGAAQLQGVDASAAYDFSTKAGDFSVSGSVSRVTKYAVQRMATEPFVDLLNTSGNPNDLRGRASLRWSQRPYDASLSVNYTGGYSNTTGFPTQKVDRWITTDLHFAYTVQRNSSVANGLTIAFDVENLTDEKPPFVDNAESRIGFDPEFASPRGRTFSISLRKAW